MLDHIGNLNPQLLRELKGRLTWRNILAVIAISIVAQILMFLWFYSQLPTEANYLYNLYCMRVQDGAMTLGCSDYDSISPKSFTINWQLWWEHFAQTFYICIPFLLMVPGTYFLLSDLQNEERHGTLDFVRLSPQSASSILLGKILGVPILIYCAIASLIPFHLFTISKAGIPLSFLFSFYLMMAAGSFLVFSFTMLFGFFSKSVLKRSAQALGVAILYVLLVGAIFVPGYMIWNSETVWRTLLSEPIFYAYSDSRWFWFSLPISENVTIAHLFTLLNVVILSGWVWQGLTRCFHQPSATILKKRQSYGLVFYLQCLGLGLNFQAYTVQAYTVKEQYRPEAFGTVMLPIVLNFLIFLTLIAILSPQRQSVMDWARYRRTQSPRSSLIKDLLFQDQSPAELAIFVNLAIAGVLWFCVSWLGYQRIWSGTKPDSILVLLSLTVIALYASVVQWAIIQKTRKRNFIAIALIAILMFIPPALVTLLSFRELISTPLRDFVLLTSPFLWTITPVSVLSALLCQLSLITGINALIIRQVRQIGASEMKDRFATLKPSS
ncbi:MAG: ABC transporter permease [Leptolyngbya sp. Prado105]|jgi:hypothetical protein|nr:ABC transporter permease [Leptolyngbya sp. Prado105]